MSYILEALKKSDKKRKLGDVPDLHTDHAGLKNGGQNHRGRPRIMIFLAGVVLVNMVLWILWWAPWQSGKEHLAALQPIPLEEKDDHPLLPPDDDVAVPAKSLPSDMAPHRNDLQIETTKTESIAEPGSPQPAIESSAAAPSVVSEENSATVSAPVAEPEPVAEIKVIAKKDLPDRVMARLPNLQISMHFFSDRPAARLVRINDKHLGEGEYVTDDLQVVAITREGVILEFEGYRFLMDKR